MSRNCREVDVISQEPNSYFKKCEKKKCEMTLKDKLSCDGERERRIDLRGR
jgi:hypothetical protein